MIAGLSYHLARQDPANRSHGKLSGFRSLLAGSAPLDDKTSLANATKLRDRRSRGESTEQIAKEIKRALGHQFEVFTPDGRINATLLEMAGIPSDRRDEVQRAFDDITKAASASLRARMVPDDAKSAPEKRIHAYRIPADPAEADRLLGNLKQVLVSACGETATAILIEVYAPDYRFAGFGRYDVALKRSPRIGVHSQAGQPDVEFDTGEFDYQFVVTDPHSTKLVMEMNCLENHERENFGTLLDPPPWE